MLTKTHAFTLCMGHSFTATVTITSLRAKKAALEMLGASKSSDIHQQISDVQIVLHLYTDHTHILHRWHQIVLGFRNVKQQHKVYECMKENLYMAHKTSTQHLA